MWGIHRWLINSLHKGPVTREMFPCYLEVKSFQSTGTPSSNTLQRLRWQVTRLISPKTGCRPIFPITCTLYSPKNHDDVINILCVSGPLWEEFPSQNPVTRSFGVFYYLRLSKQLSKQSRDWWFEAPSRPLWRHCNNSGHGPCCGCVY